MEHQDAINYIREFLTTLHSNPDIYEDGTCNIIQALEEFAIPSLEKDIYKKPYLAISYAECYRTYYACPNCQEYIKYEYSFDKLDYEPERCTYCGQALDWD